MDGSGITPLVQAQHGAQDVRIVDTSTTLPVEIDSLLPLEVKIIEIAKRFGGDWEKLPVRIEDVRFGILNTLPVDER